MRRRSRSSGQTGWIGTPARDSEATLPIRTRKQAAHLHRPPVVLVVTPGQAHAVEGKAPLGEVVEVCGTVGQYQWINAAGQLWYSKSVKK